ncbi:MAG: hypothetical protein ACP5RT_01990 [Candidatus Micrarchaeia archaeon]
MKHSFYDISYFSVNGKLEALLGYRKIFTIGRDIYLNENRERTMVSDSEWRTFPNKNNVIGVIVNKVDKSLFQKIKEEEKILIIDVSSLNADFLKEARRLRGVMKNAIHFKLKIAIASFAKNEDYLLSKAQLIEIAKFLGAGEEQAKEMLCSIGVEL